MQSTQTLLSTPDSVMQIQTLTPSASESPNSMESAHYSLGEKLRNTLREEESFELFMGWISREFSSECLLSVIEFSQFQAVLREHGQIREIDVLNGETDICFYPGIPQSSIVHEMSTVTTNIDNVKVDSSESVNNMLCVARIAGALYQKYIRRHCELEINISWTLRNQWDSLHFKKYPQQDFNVLDKVTSDLISEMLKFIRQSFVRYSLINND